MKEKGLTLNELLMCKAKRVDNGEWIEGYYCPKKPYCFDNRVEPKSYIITEFSSTGIVSFEIDESTLCRFTGFYDTKKQKIWEYDITDYDDVISMIRYDEDEGSFVIDDYGTKCCLMEYGWDEDAGEFDVVDTNKFNDFCTPISDWFEIIGNKFDNPELLKA